MDEIGLDGVCAAISDGRSLTAIAKDAGVGLGTLMRWISADAARFARVNQAREATSWLWDEQAEEEIRIAKNTKAGVAKAKELAQHFRWRASKIDPRRYGDKLDVNHGGLVGVVGIPYDPDTVEPKDREVLQRLLLKPPPTVEHEEE